MGTSARYSSASDKPEIADASGSSPISASIPNDDIRAALARVDQSLKLVLVAISPISNAKWASTTPSSTTCRSSQTTPGMAPRDC